MSRRPTFAALAGLTYTDAAMISSCLLVATAILASSHTAVGQQTQLDMARVPQPVQRTEFPLVGEESAFKFSFVDQGVCEHSVTCVHSAHARRSG
jgi:hypothetical protein